MATLAGVHHRQPTGAWAARSCQPIAFDADEARALALAADMRGLAVVVPVMHPHVAAIRADLFAQALPLLPVDLVERDPAARQRLLVLQTLILLRAARHLSCSLAAG